MNRFSPSLSPRLSLSLSGVWSWPTEQDAPTLSGCWKAAVAAVGSDGRVRAIHMRSGKVTFLWLILLLLLLLVDPFSLHCFRVVFDIARSTVLERWWLREGGTYGTAWRCVLSAMHARSIGAVRWCGDSEDLRAGRRRSID